jgi:tight adherence protein B
VLESEARLRGILDTVADTLRERAMLRRQIKVLTAEGRLSGVFLSVVPFVLIGVIILLAPTYFAPARNHPFFVPAVVLGLTSIFLGDLIIYRMVNFKI